jgi:hypothetical protein
MLVRRRFRRALFPKDRLASFAQEIRKKADLLPAGREREDMLTKASQADTAAHLEDWANSPGLQSPK